jgi:hypothetical protein
MTDDTRATIPPERETLPGYGPGSIGPLQLQPPPQATQRTAVALGFAAGKARILRRPTALSALLGMALVVASAIIERRAGSAGAVDRVLAGTFHLIIPLVCFGVAAEASGRERLADAVWPLARLGIARRDVALGTVAAAALASAALSAFFAAASVVLAHAPGGAPLVTDMLLSAWIGALTAAAYSGWFMLGATFLPRGRGRFLVLAADFLVGGSSGFFGAMFPRGNAESLLGGPAPLHLAQAESSVLLGLSALVLGLCAALRCRE